jgi:hypothetical protein
MSSEQWWMEVVRRTYRGTETLSNCLDEKEIEKVLPVAFNTLYNKVFNTKEGWVLKEDALYTVVKLREWRDQGAGPKIGIISNYDVRMKNILEGETEAERKQSRGRGDAVYFDSHTMLTMPHYASVMRSSLYILVLLSVCPPNQL